jgi:hypothetical protein
MTDLETSRREAGWMTSREVADFLGVSMQYVERLHGMRLLKSEKLAGRRMYRRGEIEAYRDSHPRLGERARKTTLAS